MADFVARPPTSAAGAAALATTLPSDADLDAPGPQRSLAYDRAWWFTRFVADAYGRRRCVGSMSLPAALDMSTPSPRCARCCAVTPPTCLRAGSGGLPASLSRWPGSCW
ncbi:peptidase MA superfamily protein [Mycobacterium xenopi 3993]|nr:peptidase MA superfamily protein [Mycobacterium xenopi 3993]